MNLEFGVFVACFGVLSALLGGRALYRALGLRFHCAPAPPGPPPPAAGSRKIFGADPLVTLFRLVVCYGVILFVFRVLLLPIAVVGTSMTPTYMDGDSNFVNRWPYSLHAPQRRDVVAVRVNPKTLYLKRIMGLPGETVSVRAGRLYINGKRLEEPYAYSRVGLRFGEVKLGPNEYFIIGDNRPVTVLGVIKRDQIVGKVVF